ncbi:hypothetical protein CBR_g17941 [Chara braunii]|uniref:Uncharacterized protein n=1 Tax=Chara braunii TaxID=69332 RepID=A0A388KVZ2_CHABU|nr:hypothetical protein CBR_g17941 [Chara braunii]|eukprot:GBG74229.1 hypothetical protein CBR_g17941 [Chara braunii]
MAAARDGRRTEGEGGGGGGGGGVLGERVGAGEAGDRGRAEGASAGLGTAIASSARLRRKLRGVRVVRYAQEEGIRRLPPRCSAAISAGNGPLGGDDNAVLVAIAAAIRSCAKRGSDSDKGGGAESVERSEAAASSSLPRLLHRTDKRMELSCIEVLTMAQVRNAIPNADISEHAQFTISKKGMYKVTGERIEDGGSKDKVEQGDWWLKQVWEQRPGWLRVWNPNLPAFPVPIIAQRWEKPCKGDHTALETVANVLTSVPFIVIGLNTHRMAMSTPKLKTKESLRMYGKSVIG